MWHEELPQLLLTNKYHFISPAGLSLYFFLLKVSEMLCYMLNEPLFKKKIYNKMHTLPEQKAKHSNLV